MVTPDGTVEASYLGRREATGYEVDLDIYIPGLEYGGLLRLLDSNSEVDGRLYLDTHLRSRYSDGASLTQHLNGKLDMMVIPENVPADFLDLWASNLIFALLPGSGNSKKMNCMVARFEVENGVMHSKTTFLDSTEVIVRARGHIDLANETIHLRVAPQAKREKFFSVSAPVEVSGPLSDFKVEVAPGGFINTMFRWYYGLIYVPWKWLTGERFPAEGLATCQKAMEMD